MENDRKHDDLCVGSIGIRPRINKELASKHQEHQMEGSMHMRRMEDGYMHRRMQKSKIMQGNDLDTPTSCFCQLKAGMEST